MRASAGAAAAQREQAQTDDGKRRGRRLRHSPLDDHAQQRRSGIGEVCRVVPGAAFVLAIRVVVNPHCEEALVDPTLVVGFAGVPVRIVEGLGHDPDPAPTLARELILRAIYEINISIKVDYILVGFAFTPTLPP